MSQRYFMRLSYRGAPFHGWQSQTNAVSVQETIEKALSMVCRTEISITGAGRTDTGVNAKTMIAHFDADLSIDATELVRRLNSIVGNDIAIDSITPMHNDAHARFDAISRSYKYFVHTQKSPFHYPLSWRCTSPTLDFEIMNVAAQKLLEYTDFTSFSKLHTDVATNNCKITYARWEREGDQWVFTITADRFLRNMVRAIVGTLVEVGRHKISVEQFCEIIEKKDRCSAGTSMPGNALFLWDVIYPY